MAANGLGARCGLGTVEAGRAARYGAACVACQWKRPSGRSTQRGSRYELGAARYGISVGVNPKTNVGLGVPRAGTANQKAMRNEKAFTKRLNLPPS